jgi:hypothetical protein
LGRTGSLEVHYPVLKIRIPLSAYNCIFKFDQFWENTGSYYLQKDNSAYGRIASNGTVVGEPVKIVKINGQKFVKN